MFYINEVVYIAISKDINILSLNGRFFLLKQGVYKKTVVDIYSLNELNYFVFDFDQSGKDYIEYISDGRNLQKLI